MLKIIVLICSVSTPGPDCSANNALQVVRLPGPPTIICGIDAQGAIAANSVKPALGYSYAKIVCERVREAAR